MSKGETRNTYDVPGHLAETHAEFKEFFVAIMSDIMDIRVLFPHRSQCLPSDHELTDTGLRVSSGHSPIYGCLQKGDGDGDRRPARCRSGDVRPANPAHEFQRSTFADAAGRVRTYATFSGMTVVMRRTLVLK